MLEYGAIESDVQGTCHNEVTILCPHEWYLVEQCSPWLNSVVSRTQASSRQLVHTVFIHTVYTATICRYSVLPTLPKITIRNVVMSY